MIVSEAIPPSVVQVFRMTVYEHFRKHGRKFPWRTAQDPYHILISEIMLQQTQVERVILKYEPFIERFPDVVSLASANLTEILDVWQGLGYNRRALALQRIAQRVVDEFDGNIPDSLDTLRTFSGIGEATAGAIAAFAFNRPAFFIETNVRRVFLHFFFPGQQKVSDRQILPLVEQTIDTQQPRKWYYALMDYGSMLKSLEVNPNRRSAHYRKQAPFRNSDRQIRGQILRALIKRPQISVQELFRTVKRGPERLDRIINQLVNEGFLTRTGDLIAISSDRERPDRGGVQDGPGSARRGER
jgi:A/G-specific adenine glycosylase